MLQNLCITVLVLVYAVCGACATDIQFVQTNTSINIYGLHYDGHHGYANKLLVDSSVKSKLSLSYNAFDATAVASLSPLQLNILRDKWNFLPEYYIFLKNNSSGKIAIGRHISLVDNLRVDATTFGFDSMTNYVVRVIYENKWPEYNWSSTIFAPGLYSNRRSTFLSQYIPKISYLSPLMRDKLYFAIAYIPYYSDRGSMHTYRKIKQRNKDIIQTGIYYGYAISSKTQIKTSLSFEFQRRQQRMNVNNWNIGFNLKYIGMLIGGSYGDGIGQYHYTSGVGYVIGPVQASLTYIYSSNKSQQHGLQPKSFKSLVLGTQYNITKHITSYLEVGGTSFAIIDSVTSKKFPSTTIICGIKIAC